MDARLTYDHHGRGLARRNAMHPPAVASGCTMQEEDDHRMGGGIRES